MKKLILIPLLSSSLMAGGVINSKTFTDTTTPEIDSFWDYFTISKSQGFSYEDFIMNTVGAMLLHTQDLITVIKDD